MRLAIIILAGLLPLACKSSKHDDVVPPAGTGDGPAGGNLDAAGSPASDGSPAAPGDGSPDASGPAMFAAWPADSTIIYASGQNALGKNISGLFYEPASGSAPAILWAIQNDPSKLYRLVWNGTMFASSSGDGWTTGKALRYTSGKGSPDSEGVTRTEWTLPEIYVIAERDNDDDKVVRETILRYELTGDKGVISATHEWELTGDLPTTVLNHGTEAIAWVPDGYLVQRGFVDESRQAVYDPATYPNHGTGIFLVGIDGTGMIYGYVLDHVAGTFARLTAFSSGLGHTMDLAFDRDVSVLWTQCGSDCNNYMALLDIDADPSSPTRGHFILRATVPPPKSLKNLNNEGFTIAPESECSNGLKSVFWADDAEKGGYAIRKGQITCGRLY